MCYIVHCLWRSEALLTGSHNFASFAIHALSLQSIKIDNKQKIQKRGIRLIYTQRLNILTTLKIPSIYSIDFVQFYEAFRTRF